MQIRPALDGLQPPGVASNGQYSGKRGTAGHGQRDHQIPAWSHGFLVWSKT